MGHYEIFAAKTCPAPIFEANIQTAHRRYSRERRDIEYQLNWYERVQSARSRKEGSSPRRRRKGAGRSWGNSLGIVNGEVSTSEEEGTPVAHRPPPHLPSFWQSSCRSPSSFSQLRSSRHSRLQGLIPYRRN